MEELECQERIEPGNRVAKQEETDRYYLYRRPWVFGSPGYIEELSLGLNDQELLAKMQELESSMVMRPRTWGRTFEHRYQRFSRLFGFAHQIDTLPLHIAMKGEFFSYIIDICGYEQECTNKQCTLKADYDNCERCGQTFNTRSTRRSVVAFLSYCVHRLTNDD